MLTRRSVMARLAALGFVAGCANQARPASPADFGALRARLAGDVIIPASPEYETARRTFSFSPRTDRHPAAIARCVNADDVARAIEFARRHSLPLAVRSGGHDVLAASTCDNGLVIDLGRMNGTQRSESGSSIVVGPGTHSGAILKALAPFGEVVPLGDYSEVGVAGLTLGGGLGMLHASRGATCDNLLRARLVTADGRQLTASPKENPDLFWALRGGGGNFGVVTELELATHHVPSVIGGVIVFDGKHLADFLRFFPDYMARAPRELMADARVVAAERPIVFVVVCFTGSAAAAERVLAPLRAFAPLLADGVRASPYVSAMASTPAVQAVLAGGAKKAPVWNGAGSFAWLGGSIRELDESVSKAVLSHVKKPPASGWALSLGHHMHGAVCDVGFDASPLPRPRNAFTYHVDAWWGDPALAAPGLAWIDSFAAALAPHSIPSYINYLSTDDPAGIAAAYGPSFARLRGLKRRYDPDNVFRRNRNILPA